MIFEKADWIWTEKEHVDQFVDFLYETEGGEGQTQMLISAHDDYNLYINGELVSFGQYRDYAEYQIYDEIDVTKYMKTGKNRFFITVWHYGIETSVNKNNVPALIFEIYRDGKLTGFSSNETLQAESETYVSGESPLITPQTGLSFTYDSLAEDSSDSAKLRMRTSVVKTGISKTIYKRPVKPLVLEEAIDSETVKLGNFTYDRAGKPGEKMQHAVLFEYDTKNASFPIEIESAEEYDGVFAVVDLHYETAGFVSFDIDVNEDCEIDIGFGEHLIDGRCRTSVKNRDFAAKYYAKKGNNKFLGSFRRIGCRYVQIFALCTCAKLNYLGLKPTVYPVREKNAVPESAFERRVYGMCVRTLKQCMHEHYEDGPWREQALYVTDTRNQMLCGYYAFEGYEFQRASLKLMSFGMTESGLLSICFPCGSPKFTIPAYSLMYFVSVYEYIRYSKDLTLAEEVYPILTALANSFVERTGGDGLLPCFEGQWNFYEWSEGMNGGMSDHVTADIEAPLNAFFVIAAVSMAKISYATGREEDGKKFDSAAERTRKALSDFFFDPIKKLFATRKGDEAISVFTNALCVLCGAAEGKDCGEIAKILVKNASDGEKTKVVPCTLGMNCFRYDALLKIGGGRYTETILEDIKKDYAFMLRNGATTSWETIKGAADFHGAGSLCHGWSAMPVYYYNIFGRMKQKNEKGNEH